MIEDTQLASLTAKGKELWSKCGIRKIVASPLAARAFASAGIRATLL